MTKLRPWEVNLLAYPNEAHMNFGASSPRVMFLDVYGFGFMFIIKRTLEPHCNHLIMNERSRHISS
jgi:hypothetical protein